MEFDDYDDCATHFAAQYQNLYRELCGYTSSDTFRASSDAKFVRQILARYPEWGWSHDAVQTLPEGDS